jgi:hypothetical protein
LGVPAKTHDSGSGVAFLGITLRNKQVSGRKRMGIRVQCPNGHTLNVKAELAGMRGICPECGAKFPIAAPPEQAAEPVVAQPPTVPKMPPAPEPIETPPPLEAPELTLSPRPASPQARTIRQKIRRRNQVKLTVVLAVSVAILGAILFWILAHYPNG